MIEVIRASAWVGVRLMVSQIVWDGYSHVFRSPKMHALSKANVSTMAQLTNFVVVSAD